MRKKTKEMLHAKAEVIKRGAEGIVEAVVGSTDVVDRMGDIIDQDGWNLRAYKKNPVILWGHNIKEERLPIGRALRVWLAGEGKAKGKKQLMFKIQFDLQDTFAAEVFRKVKAGFLNTVSVGFIPLEREENVFTKAELLELSFVPVPANPEALVAIKDMGKKYGFKPVKTMKKLYEKPKKKKVDLDAVVKPLPNEHACRLRNPGDFKEDSFRSTSRTHKGKKYRVIMGKLKDKDTMTDQSFRYKKATWEASTAKAHCKSHEGSFEQATGKKGSKKKPTKDDLAVGIEDGLKDKKDPKKTLGVVPFKSFDVLPEGTEWDIGKEIKKADTKDLKLMATWFNPKKPDIKESYKLLHHRQDDKKVVWRGVAGAMAILLGAKGGIDIPKGDREGVYGHLAKHYKQYDKSVPDFRMVEDQILAGLDEEIHAIVLEREAKYTVRLIKKVLKEAKTARKKVENKEKKERTKKKRSPTQAELNAAVEVVSSALSSFIGRDSLKGGDEKG